MLLEILDSIYIIFDTHPILDPMQQIELYPSLSCLSYISMLMSLHVVINLIVTP